MLAGEGMSQVVRSLQELLARRTYYSGDLLFSVDILRNVTDTFKRATYVPSADDVQVPRCASRGGAGDGEVPNRRGSLSPCGRGSWGTASVAVLGKPTFPGTGTPDPHCSFPSASSKW